MATVTGFTAERMAQVEAECIVNGAVILDDLILTRNDGSSFNAGSVRGPRGAQGLPGKDAATGAVAALPNTTPIRTNEGRIKAAPATESDDVWPSSQIDAYHDLIRKTTLMQRLFHGGGGRRAGSSTQISWTTRFILIGSGRDAYSPSGYFDINMPPDGTVIPVYGDSVRSSVTVAGGYITLGTWDALYYELPLGQTSTGKPENFRLVSYTAAQPYNPIPEHWVLVVVRNNDSYSPRFVWGDGKTTDYWRNITLSNSWVSFDPAAYAEPAIRIADDGSVVMRGLIKAGTFSSATPAYTLNSVIWPSDREIFIVESDVGHARVDVRADGGVLIYGGYNGGSNGWVSLANIRWFPGG